MKNNLLGTTIAVLALISTACGSRALLERQGNSLRLERGNAEFVFSEDSHFEVELRVFGVNINDFKSGHMAAPTHLLVVTPTADMREIFANQLCEKGGVDKASMVQTIVQDEALAKRLETLGEAKQPCMRLGGTTLRLDTLTLDGQMLPVEDFQMTSSMPWDFRTFVLIDDVSGIDCG